MKTCDNVSTRLAGQRGVSLIAMSFLLVGLGLFSLPAIQIYKAQNNLSAKAETDEKIADVQKAMGSFYAQYGRYPCPAPLNAAIDTPTYGREISSDCTIATTFAGSGTERAAGRDGRMVRTGTIPTRTLGIPDSYMTDGYKQRLVYAVTEAYAVQNTPAPRDSGAITVIDGASNNSTSTPGNVALLVYSAGGDLNGTYDMNGVNLQACSPTARSGQNCDFATNATFRNTVQKSQSQSAANRITNTISYMPNKDVVPCDDSARPGLAKNTMFLVDTSGSMSEKVTCPPGLTGSCNRMDLAHWAMRRVIPARMYHNTTITDPGSTGITGFRCSTASACAKMNETTFKDTTFDDPTAAGYTPPDEASVSTKLEKQLTSLCPSGNTPLGDHVRAISEKLKSGTADRPNKLTILSDGESNMGADPVKAARDLIKLYPNLQVDVVDMTNNAGLRQIADLTGGKYYSASDPKALEDSLYDSAGVCKPHTPPVIVDKKNCR